MAWNIPKQIGSLLVGDDATQRAIGNVHRALQPVLDFCNSTFTVAQNGALQLVRDVVTQALTVNGPVSASGPCTFAAGIGVTGSVNVSGGVIVRGSQVIYGANNCLVIVPSVTSGVIFYTTNPANTTALFNVYADGSVLSAGTVTGNSVVSAQGFVRNVWMGTYWSTSATTTVTSTQCHIFNQNGGAVSTMNRNYTCTRAGSITGFSMVANNTVGVNGTYYMYRNNVLVFTVSHLANQAVANATYAKGAVPVIRGDILRVGVVYPNGTNIASNVDIELEGGA